MHPVEICYFQGLRSYWVSLKTGSTGMLETRGLIHFSQASYWDNRGTAPGVIRPRSEVSLSWWMRAASWTAAACAP